MKDYSCNLISRERMNGKLNESAYLFLKVRHEPLSIYAYFQDPNRGSEVIYAEGKNGGKLLAHETGPGGRSLLTVSLDPLGLKDRPLVPLELEPPQRVEDLLDVLRSRSLAVGIFDPQHEAPAASVSQQPVE